MKTYAIGDVQGCFDTLTRLLKILEFNPQHDKLLFAGDLVNRGPLSLKTLRFIKNLGAAAQTVLGNHDLTLIATAYGYRIPHASDTLDAILQAPDKIELIEWLRFQPFLIEQSNYLLTHAGVPHIWSYSNLKTHAFELAMTLQSDTLIHPYLANLYGAPSDHWNALTNYFTRMRMCDINGQLDLNYKKGVPDSDSEPPPSSKFAPWFQYKNTDVKLSQYTYLFGHWAALNGITHSSKHIALDTGCVWGKALTAFCLEKGNDIIHAKISIPC